jgi:DNA adenine methylase/adenine-specific DNA-methyltransferase
VTSNVPAAEGKPLECRGEFEPRQLSLDLEPSYGHQNETGSGSASLISPGGPVSAPPSQRGSIRQGFKQSDSISVPLPLRVADYPEFRYMGSKHRLLPWVHQVLSTIEFKTAADPFVGSGCVSYLMKSMGKQVKASDFLNFPAVIAEATVANQRYRLNPSVIERLLTPVPQGSDFITRTFSGIFYNVEDLRFLDSISARIDEIANRYLRAMALAALIRSCLKKQPRGVFTVSGNLARYDDGRRDLRLSLRDHFLEQAQIFNKLVFDNGQRNFVRHSDVLDLYPENIDLVYLDPPYVPRSDDNFYIKRYHFLEGLSCYWRGLEIMNDTKVRKIRKKNTPFAYRKTALDAFERLFRLFQDSIILLSYSSNGFPDLAEIEALMRRYKPDIVIHRKPHRYHFGTHSAVGRAAVQEYLIVGR